MGSAGTLLRMGALALMWGSSFLWIKLGLDTLSPVQLVLVRVLLGAMVLAGLCQLRRLRLPRQRRVWRHLVVAALFGNALPFLAFAYGEQTTDSGVAGVLNSTTPLWALLIAVLIGQQRSMNPLRLLGLLLGFGGTLLIFAPWQAGDLMTWGALACLGAAASYAISFSYIGRHLAGRGLSPMVLAASQMITACGLTVFALPAGGTASVQLEVGPLLAVVVLGVFSTGFAFVLNYRLIADEGVVVASTVGYLLPVVSVLLGTVFLGESLNPRVIAGMIVVLAGVALTRRPDRPATTTALPRNPPPESRPRPRQMR
ncbi:MAG: EamA family transporter [Pseudonocardiaceae bacterium]|nr:EamA family transporter [Pseudonocardiaceae bacterium]